MLDAAKAIIQQREDAVEGAGTSGSAAATATAATGAGGSAKPAKVGRSGADADAADDTFISAFLEMHDRNSGIVTNQVRPASSRRSVERSQAAEAACVAQDRLPYVLDVPVGATLHPSYLAYRSAL